MRAAILRRQVDRRRTEQHDPRQAGPAGGFKEIVGARHVDFKGGLGIPVSRRPCCHSEVDDPFDLGKTLADRGKIADVTAMDFLVRSGGPIEERGRVAGGFELRDDRSGGPAEAARYQHVHKHTL